MKFNEPYEIQNKHNIKLLSKCKEIQWRFFCDRKIFQIPKS